MEISFVADDGDPSGNLAGGQNSRVTFEKDGLQMKDYFMNK